MVNRTDRLLITIMMLLCGCASQSKQLADKEAVFPEIDVAATNGRIEAALQGVQDGKVRLDTLDANAAEFDEKILFVSEEAEGFTPARIEEIEARLSLLTEAIKEQQEQIIALKQEPANSREPPKTQGPLKPQQKSGGKPAAENVNQSTALAPAAALLISHEYNAYQSGLRLFNAGNYKQAIAAFNEQLRQFPDGKYTDNALYWTGESCFRLSDYPSAIAAFEKAAALHGSPKAGGALFKIALSYLKTGQKEMAAASFKRIVDEFPDSEYASRAEKYLNRIK